MNHEYETHDQLPTAEGLFHRAGELAVLHGRIDDVDNENETSRRFILDKFPQDIKRKFPQLREITYIPSYMIEGEPSGDMLWVTLSDADVRSQYMLERNELDEYSVEVDHAAVEQPAGPYVSQEQSDVTDAAIDALFADGAINSEAVEQQAENIDFLLSRDTAPTPADLLLLDEIVASVSVHYPQR